MHRKYPKQATRRYMTLVDTALLDVPAQKEIFDWWFECKEIDPDSNCPRYEYTLFVDLNKEVSEWCDAMLMASPDFKTPVFTISEDLLFQPLTDSITACTETVRLEFVTADDLVHFKVRWL